MTSDWVWQIWQPVPKCARTWSVEKLVYGLGVNSFLFQLSIRHQITWEWMLIRRLNKSSMQIWSVCSTSLTSCGFSVLFRKLYATWIFCSVDLSDHNSLIHRSQCASPTWMWKMDASLWYVDFWPVCVREEKNYDLWLIKALSRVLFSFSYHTPYHIHVILRRSFKQNNICDIWVWLAPPPLLSVKVNRVH